MCAVLSEELEQTHDGRINIFAYIIYIDIFLSLSLHLPTHRNYSIC